MQKFYLRFFVKRIVPPKILGEGQQLYVVHQTIARNSWTLNSIIKQLKKSDNSTFSETFWIISSRFSRDLPLIFHGISAAVHSGIFFLKYFSGPTLIVPWGNLSGGSSRTLRGFTRFNPVFFTRYLPKFLSVFFFRSSCLDFPHSFCRDFPRSFFLKILQGFLLKFHSVFVQKVMPDFFFLINSENFPGMFSRMNYGKNLKTFWEEFQQKFRDDFLQDISWKYHMISFCVPPGISTKDYPSTFPGFIPIYFSRHISHRLFADFLFADFILRKFFIGVQN